MLNERISFAIFPSFNSFGEEKDCVAKLNLSGRQGSQAVSTDLTNNPTAGAPLTGRQLAT